MSKSTDKEQARRAAIEADWVMPNDPIEAHATEADERPSTASHIIAALSARGWSIEGERTAVISGPPTWKTYKPDDPTLSFVSEPVSVYHLVATNPGDGDLVAVEVMQVNGTWTIAHLGFGVLGGKGRWEAKPVASIAKFIREAS